MAEDTVVTALADGSYNCWSVLLSLAPHCQQVICILDWFHIAKRFQNVRGAVEEAFQETWEPVKWSLWHGKSAEALSKLKILMTNVTDTKKRKKLEGPYDYLKRNHDYLVNYEGPEEQKQMYTSQVAESHIESIINARHKWSGKMQWTREGEHNVLQIRGKIIGNEWSDQWQEPVMAALGAVV
ncbi:MAG: hypothetical protein WCA35_22760 [Kovacikia sp.]